MSFQVSELSFSKENAGLGKGIPEYIHDHSFRDGMGAVHEVSTPVPGRAGGF